MAGPAKDALPLPNLNRMERDSMGEGPSIIVSDVDGTLLLPSGLSRWLWGFARFLEVLGRLFQHPNVRVVDRLRGARTVIILTSRDCADREFTLRQLKRAGVEPSRAIFCSREELYLEWKRLEISKLEISESTEWIDDAISGRKATCEQQGTSTRLKVTHPSELEIR